MAKSLKKQCDDLWILAVKLKAGYKSELSYQEGRQIGGEHILHSHHIARKPNHRLRYELDNGICLTAWEHRYGIHGDHEESYREKIKRVRGEDIYEKLSLLRNAKSKDLRLTKMYLENKIKELQ